MRVLAVGPNTLTSCAAAAMLAGCGGSQPPGAMPQTFAIATHADRGKSWMLPEAKRIKVLIYASEGNINVYDYDTAKQVGSLTALTIRMASALTSGEMSFSLLTSVQQAQFRVRARGH